MANIQMTLRTSLVKNVGQSVGVSLILFIAALVTTPLMTRLFAPEAYGVNGMMVRAATILSGIGLLGLPIALAREHRQREQKRLLCASLEMAVILSVLSVGGYVVLPRLIPGAPFSVIAIFPILVFFYCVNLTTRSFGTANGLFPAMAKGRLGDGLGSRGLSLLGGLALHAGAMTMVIADIAGKTIGAFAILWSGRRLLQHETLGAVRDLSRLTRTIRDYRDHATYSNLATILPILAVFLVEASIAKRFGIDDTGQYTLAVSILGLPVSLIALASAPIIFHRLVTEADKRDGQLGYLSLLAFFASAGAGAVCMAPVLLFGPDLFALFFGERWRISGIVAQSLALPMILNFSSTVLLSVFRVCRKLPLWFAIELLGVLGFVGCILQESEVPLERYVHLLSVAYLIRFFFIHAGVIYALRGARSGSEDL